MLITREVVRSAMEVARQQMSELLSEPAAVSNETVDETQDPHSSATSTPGIVTLK